MLIDLVELADIPRSLASRAPEPASARNARARAHGVFSACGHSRIEAATHLRIVSHVRVVTFLPNVFSSSPSDVGEVGLGT